MRVISTPNALHQLDDVLTYIDERSPKGATRLKTRMRDVVAILAQHPLVGHATSRAGQRRLVICPYPDAIFYRVRGDAFIIQRIRHTARRHI